jgi:hypothetical protein
MLTTQWNAACLWAGCIPTFCGSGLALRSNSGGAAPQQIHRGGLGIVVSQWINFPHRVRCNETPESSVARSGHSTFRGIARGRSSSCTVQPGDRCRKFLGLMPRLQADRSVMSIQSLSSRKKPRESGSARGVAPTLNGLRGHASCRGCVGPIMSHEQGYAHTRLNLQESLPSGFEPAPRRSVDVRAE